MTDLKEICRRSGATLAQDFAAASLLCMAFVGVLHLPGLF